MELIICGLIALAVMCLFVALGDEGDPTDENQERW